MISKDCININRKLPNMYTDYSEFLNKIKTNTDHDLFEHRFRGESDPSIFKRYSSNFTVDSATYQQVAKQLLDVYINPLMEVSGYRFPIRDYHKGGRKAQRISFMFICSQDKSQKRKSRSNENRTTPNRLKVEECNSKLSLTYSLQDGIITIFYNHKSHKPYIWKKNRDQLLDNTENRPSFDDINFVDQLHQLKQPLEQVNIQQPMQPPIFYDQYQRYQFFPNQQQFIKHDEKFTQTDAAAQIIAVAQQAKDKKDSEVIDKDLININE